MTRKNRLYTAAKKRKGSEEPTSQAPSGADLDSRPPLVGDDFALELAKKESLLAAQKQGKVGPRNIPGWTLQDVEDKGNCFYDSVVHQMRSISSFQDFLTSVHDTTNSRDSLRLHIQGREFKDMEWADQSEIEKLARCFNAVVAIVDTRGDMHNFVYHYIRVNGIYNTTSIRAILPLGRPIIKLAFTGNHYMSVVSHPYFDLQPAHITLHKANAGTLFSGVKPTEEQQQPVIIPNRSKSTPPKKIQS